MKSSTPIAKRLTRIGFAKNQLSIFLFLIHISWVGTVMAQDASQLTDEDVNRLNQIATQDVPTGAPGIATGIILDGEVIYSKCAGLEDITNQNLITPQSRFNIASTGKQFTALAIIRLEADKKLSLKDDIREYFPELYKQIESPITIEHLLTHTSGVRDIHHLWSLQGLTWWKHEFGNQDAMKLLRKQEDLNFEPGDAHLYSNSNYILLAELVSKVSGISFVAYTDAMFRQLGMPNTSFESDHTKIRGSIAKPYFNFQTWKGYDWLSNLVGDGCLFSTLEDQLQWECLIQGSGKTNFSRTLIEKSQQLVNTKLSEDYGFGLEFRNEAGLKTRFHEGSTGAWKAYTLRYPDKRFAIVTLSNSGKTIPSIQSRQMVSVLLNTKSQSSTVLTQPEKTGVRVEPAEIEGMYLADNGFFFQFVLKEGRLFLRREGRNDVLLERESANVFHEVNDPKFKQEFIKNRNQDMQVTAYHNTHAPYSLTRSVNDWTNFDINSLVGSFSNSETGGEFKIEHVKDRTFNFTIKGKKTRTAQLVSTNRLVCGSYVIQWSGKLEQDTPLMLNTSRIRNVKFTRLPTKKQPVPTQNQAREDALN